MERMNIPKLRNGSKGSKGESNFGAKCFFSNRFPRAAIILFGGLGLEMGLCFDFWLWIGLVSSWC